MIGCTPLKSYRPERTLCSSADPERDCATHALQQYQPSAGAAGAYLLGFIEFDDQGQLFDRRQMEAVLGAVSAAAQQSDYLNVVFVHGWKHNASPQDDNVQTFRKVLAQLSATEEALGKASGDPPRKVIGVYLGWRGASITAWGIQEATFWDRKNTAHKVGHGDVTEVLNRLDAIRQTKNAPPRSSGDPRGSQLVVVGHSFGGAVLYSALSQIIVERFVSTAGRSTAAANAAGFGNLVVLINPAFEAQLYSSVNDISMELAGYATAQLPVLVVMTSVADTATGFWFPLGRWFSTRFEQERAVIRENAISHQAKKFDQRQMNVKAVGHYDGFRTHDLKASDGQGVKLSGAQRARSAVSVASEWENDAPGRSIQLPGSILQRTAQSAGRNPYLMIRVDGKLIPNHDDITDPRVLEFISHMILLSGQTHDLATRQARRQRIEANLSDVNKAD